MSEVVSYCISGIIGSLFVAWPLLRELNKEIAYKNLIILSNSIKVKVDNTVKPRQFEKTSLENPLHFRVK